MLSEISYSLQATIDILDKDIIAYQVHDIGTQLRNTIDTKDKAKIR
jgi:hypothetical protein